MLAVSLFHHVVLPWVATMVAALAAAGAALALAAAALSLLEPALRRAREAAFRRRSEVGARGAALLRGRGGEGTGPRPGLERLARLLPAAGRALLWGGILAAAGFLIGAVWLRNPSAALVLAFLGILLPGRLAGRGGARRREAFLRQLGPAVRTFAAALEATGSARTALEVAAERSPRPVRDALAKAADRLRSENSVEEAAKVIRREVPLGHAALFAALLEEADREGAALLPQFARLASQADALYEMHMENLAAVAPGRTTNVLLHLGVVALAVAVSWVVPDARKYLTEEPGGRVVVTLTFASVLLSTVLDRLWTRVDL